MGGKNFTPILDGIMRLATHRAAWIMEFDPSGVDREKMASTRQKTGQLW